MLDLIRTRLNTCTPALIEAPSLPRAAVLLPLYDSAADEASLARLREVRTKVYQHLKADAQRRAVPMLG